MFLHRFHVKTVCWFAHWVWGPGLQPRHKITLHHHMYTAHTHTKCTSASNLFVGKVFSQPWMLSNPAQTQQLLTCNPSIFHDSATLKRQISKRPQPIDLFLFPQPRCSRDSARRRERDPARVRDQPPQLGELSPRTAATRSR